MLIDLRKSLSQRYYGGELGAVSNSFGAVGFACTSCKKKSAVVVEPGDDGRATTSAVEVSFLRMNAAHLVVCQRYVMADLLPPAQRLRVGHLIVCPSHEYSRSRGPNAPWTS